MPVLIPVDRPSPRGEGDLQERIVAQVAAFERVSPQGLAVLTRFKTVTLHDYPHLLR